MKNEVGIIGGSFGIGFIVGKTLFVRVSKGTPYAVVSLRMCHKSHERISRRERALATRQE